LFLTSSASPTYSYLFFFHRSGHHPDLHSFPTRRSSDLYKLAYHFRNNYGNYSLLSDGFNQDWRNNGNRPYDDFTVPVYHIWKKTDRKSTRLNSSHVKISYAVFCLKKKNLK